MSGRSNRTVLPSEKHERCFSPIDAHPRANAVRALGVLGLARRLALGQSVFCRASWVAPRAKRNYTVSSRLRPYNHASMTTIIPAARTGTIVAVAMGYTYLPAYFPKLSEIGAGVPGVQLARLLPHRYPLVRHRVTDPDRGTWSAAFFYTVRKLPHSFQSRALG